MSNNRDIEKYSVKNHMQEFLSAGQRWCSRGAVRQQQLQTAVQKGSLLADLPQRAAAYLARETQRQEMYARQPLELGFGLERKLGLALELSEIAPSQEAFLAGQSVARITTRPTDQQDEPEGFGSGFLIAPGILITNHHVLPDFSAVQTSQANFGYERIDGRIRRGSYIPFSDRQQDFICDKALDFSIVALAEPITKPYLKLIADEGKILVGHQVNIIQHPEGGIKKYSLHESKLLDVLPLHLHYSTDTLKGSSGSFVSNINWEVVALHHMGVPQMIKIDGEDKFVSIFGTPWDSQTMTDEEVQWVVNEGVRISQIVKRLQQMQQELPQSAALIERILTVHAVIGLSKPLADIKTEALQGSAAVQGSPLMDSQTLIDKTMSTTTEEKDMSNPINIHINAAATVHIHQHEAIATGATAPAALNIATEAADDLLLLENRRRAAARNYDNRTGYDAQFLEREIALPVIHQPQRIAPLKNGDISGVLKYQHFSIVMDAARRLAIFTAVNIDGKQSRSLERGKDSWLFDNRLDESYQVGEGLYRANPLDRGHLVRRLDPVWGDFQTAQLANDDTFCFPNCAPQHMDLNQKIWNELENYLLHTADNQNEKLVVFTGPVFKDDDPLYRGIRIPRCFWKVAAMQDGKGGLVAVAFLQSQEKMLRLEEAAFLGGSVRTDQVAISLIEELTDLSFGDLSTFDPLRNAMNHALARGVDLNESTKPAIRTHTLNSFSDILLG